MSSKEIERCESLLEDADNTARIGDFGKAARKYMRAVEACRRVGWEDQAVMSLFLSYLYPCNQDVKEGKDPLETGSLARFVEGVSGLPPTRVVAYMPGGFYGEFDSSRLVTEARAILLMSEGLRETRMERIRELLGEASSRFAEIGSEPLIFSRYVSCLKRRSTGNSAALECEGHIELIEGARVEEVEPLKAVEYMMAASRAFRAAKLRERARAINGRIRGLRTTRRCWMCGRVAQGSRHFKIVGAEVGRYFEKVLREAGEDLRVFEDLHSIVLCRPCYTSISNEADRIAREYFDRVMEVVSRLASQVEMLAAEVRALSMRVNRLSSSRRIR